MATFKVGQRVRIIGHEPRTNGFRGERYIGKEAVITARASLAGEDWAISIDGRDEYFARNGELAPLTDPKADEERWARVKVREVTRPQPVLLQGDLETRVPHPLANEGVPCWP